MYKTEISLQKFRYVLQNTGSQRQTCKLIERKQELANDKDALNDKVFNSELLNDRVVDEKMQSVHILSYSHILIDGAVHAQQVLRQISASVLRDSDVLHT